MSFIHRLFSLALLLPVLGAIPPLRADAPVPALAPIPWIQLRIPQSDDQAESEGREIVIKYRVMNTPEGYSLEFRNDGAVTLHFGFWIKGWQAKDLAQTHGRIHLPPGEESGPVAVSIRIPGRPPASHCPLRLIQIALGEGGQGLFWRE